jgi:hypothetical protein
MPSIRTSSLAFALRAQYPLLNGAIVGCNVWQQHLEATMRVLASLFILSGMASCAIPSRAQNPHKSNLSPKVLSAKTVYFKDATGHAAVGERALRQLKKWGRFQIVANREKADLVIVLSETPSNGAIIVSGGQTGTIDSNGHVEEDAVPTYGNAAPVRYAYLTVVDRETGDVLWSDAHRWGGLLTGFNSAGESLIKEFEKQCKK